MDPSLLADPSKARCNRSGNATAPVWFVVISLHTSQAHHALEMAHATNSELDPAREVDN